MNAEILPMAKAEVMGKTVLGEKLLALNNSNAHALSWLEPERLTHLVAEALFAGRVGEVDGLLTAFDQHADYASPSFMWFQARYRRFV